MQILFKSEACTVVGKKKIVLKEMQYITSTQRKSNSSKKYARVIIYIEGKEVVSRKTKTDILQNVAEFYNRALFSLKKKNSLVGIPKKDSSKKVNAAMSLMSGQVTHP